MFIFQSVRFSMYRMAEAGVGTEERARRETRRTERDGKMSDILRCHVAARDGGRFCGDIALQSTDNNGVLMAGVDVSREVFFHGSKSGDGVRRMAEKS
jgi:FtsZ-interacting cell division protein ZipA